METNSHELEEFEGIELSEDNSVRADRMLWKIRKLEEDITPMGRRCQRLTNFMNY